jgi:putative transposase
MQKTIQKTFKYRLKPNKVQEEIFAQFAGSARYIYNYGLSKIKGALDGGLPMPTYYDLAGMLPGMKLEEQTSWLTSIHSQVLQQALMDLYKALGAFYEAKKNKKSAGFPKFRRRGKNDSFRFPQTVVCEAGKVRLPKIGWVSYRDSRPVEGTIKQATVKRQGAHWYISIVCELVLDIEKLPVCGDNAVGLDLGISCYAATSDGLKIPNPAYLYSLLEKLRCYSRQLSKKQKFGKNWKKWVVKIQRLHARIVNLRNDFQHKVSTIIAKSHGVVCVEDLNIKGMVRNGRLARSISDAAWGRFCELLNYKCDWLGKHFVKIDRFFPSTKQCSSCGNKQNMPLTVRIFNCSSCGLKLDRDINASINIKAAGLSALKACGETDSGWLREAGITGF